MTAASRDQALAAAALLLDSGGFQRSLSARVAVRSESQDPSGLPRLYAYLQQELMPALKELGFDCTLHDNPMQPRSPHDAAPGPFLVATRHEGAHLPTVLMYGHGDVIRGQDSAWTQGRGPWVLVEEGDRLYGRGTADNKGQHSINLSALACVLDLQGGHLGFNVKWLFETSEEIGSPGLAEFCRQQRHALAADVLLASDGPRWSPDRPTVFLGSRGVANFELSLQARASAHHSGNWGGLLRNPATVLAHAIASLVDARGVIRVAALRPPPIAANVRKALKGLNVQRIAGSPEIDPDWGEPGLTPTERVIAWNTLEVLAYTAGNPQHPVNAIPPAAQAFMHMRLVPGTPTEKLRGQLQDHLQAEGFGDVSVGPVDVMAATRLDPDDPWVHFTLKSLRETTGQEPVLLPNLGGSLPNDVFADILGLPTVWVPHSYAGCNQHAPNEHLLVSVARQALQIMAGLYWDLGQQSAQLPRLASRRPSVL
jgi:acetylornithine deacetylase/succinyl-diaminopimelate desuccinylase-like protein